MLVLDEREAVVAKLLALIYFVYFKYQRNYKWSKNKKMQFTGVTIGVVLKEVVVVDVVVEVSINQQ